MENTTGISSGHQHLQQQVEDAEIFELLKEAKSMLTLTLTILSLNTVGLYQSEVKIVNKGEELVKRIAKATA